MRMNGSWHIYPPRPPVERLRAWQRPRRDMRVVVATRDFEAVGFNVPVAEFLDERALQRQPDLRQLGPDLLGASFDATKRSAAFAARSDASIADALLNQRVVAGAGNVFKSEVLFLCGINPFRSCRGRQRRRTSLRSSQPDRSTCARTCQDPSATISDLHRLSTDDAARWIRGDACTCTAAPGGRAGSAERQSR